MGYQADAIEYHGATLPGPLRAEVDRFIAQAYGYLFAALLSMASLGLVSYYFAPRAWLPGLVIADSALWVLCGWFGWRRPLLFVFPLFSVITGLLLGQLAHLYTSVFLSATILTLVAFGGLSLLAHLTHDFSFVPGFLSVGFLVLLGGWMLTVLPWRITCSASRR